MSRSHGRIVVPLVAGLLAVAGGLVLGSGIASAHNPVLTASADCQGMVNWSVSSWSTGLDGSNPDIAIYYSIDDTGPQVPVARGAFNAGNGYAFSGSFPWPDTTGRVVLYAESIGAWGDGVVTPGNFQREWISLPDCAVTTTTAAVTTTTAAVTTTTAAVTTTTGAVTTTTGAATTTTAAGSGGGTTTTTAGSGGGTTTTTAGSGGGTTTTLAGSGGPTTTTGSGLPRTGSSSMSLLLIALGCCLVGSSIVMALRRQPA